MTSQLQVTRVTIGPPRPSDPPKLLCYASIVLCHSFEVANIRLVRRDTTGKARIHFPRTFRIESDGSAHRRQQAHPTNPVTRSMIEWAVLRAYREWLDSNPTQRCFDKVLVKEQTP